MDEPVGDRVREMVTPAQQVRGYLVHLLTAWGIVPALLAMMEIASDQPRPVLVFALLAAAVLIDAIDGPLARRWRIKVCADQIDGRKIDDLVDYLNFVFVPLVLVGRMEWLPDPAAAWIAPAMLASLLGFAHVGAKDEQGGFFRGFPSYWNIWAVYAGIAAAWWGVWANAAMIAGLTLLTVLPVRFVYPNLAPRPWRGAVIGGGVIWGLLLAAMMIEYPYSPPWLVGVSLVYPVFYVGVSVYLSGEKETKRLRDGEIERRRD